MSAPEEQGSKPRHPEARDEYARKSDKKDDRRVVNIDHQVTKRDEGQGKGREDFSRRGSGGAKKR
jgi:hypothetical protein